MPRFPVEPESGVCYDSYRLGVSYNGSTKVSKTFDGGSIPSTPAIPKRRVGPAECGLLLCGEEAFSFRLRKRLTERDGCQWGRGSGNATVRM